MVQATLPMLVSATVDPLCAVGGWLLGLVSDKDAQHRPSTRNATGVKKGGRNFAFCPILMKRKGSKYDTFLIFAKI